jgi:electron transfer flavoprotein alpha subunit
MHMSETREVWVFIEQEEGIITRVSLELLTKALELAQQLDGQVSGILMGNDIANLAETVIHHGAEIVPNRPSPTEHLQDTSIRPHCDRFSEGT